MTFYDFINFNIFLSSFPLFDANGIKRGGPALDLNAEHKKIAVQEPKGHFLIKGVAGSGKTRIAIRYIRNIIE